MKFVDKRIMKVIEDEYDKVWHHYTMVSNYKRMFDKDYIANIIMEINVKLKEK